MDEIFNQLFIKLHTAKARRDFFAKEIDSLGGHIPSALMSDIVKDLDSYCKDYLDSGETDGSKIVVSLLRSTRREVLRKEFGFGPGSDSNRKHMMDLYREAPGGGIKEMIEDRSLYRRLGPMLEYGSGTGELEAKSLVAVAEFVANSFILNSLRFKIESRSNKLERAKPVRPTPDTLKTEAVKKAVSFMGDFSHTMESPLLMTKSYWYKTPHPNIVKTDKQVPPGLLSSFCSNSIPVAYSRKSMQALDKAFPLKDKLTVMAGSRKGLITHAKNYDLQEAADEDILMSEVVLSYALRKRNMFRLASFHNRGGYTREYITCSPVHEMLNLKQSFKAAPGISLALGELVPKFSSSYWRDGVVPYRNNDFEGYDIDTEAEDFVNPTAVATTSRREEVRGLSKQETRYTATYIPDVGEPLVVTGTSPKRALSNIRRKIRKDIVDTLDIF